MAHWTNVLWNNSFINATRLPLCCEKTGAVALAQPDVMAGRLAGSQNAAKLKDF